MALSFCGKRLLARGSNLITSRRNTGFIVLIPEIGEDTPEKNSLLRNDGLPEFNKFTVEKCIAAMSKYSVDYETGVKSIEENADKVQNVFTNIFVPLENLHSPLELTWGLAKTLYVGNSTLMPTKTYMHIHHRGVRATACKFFSIPIYKAICKAQETQKSLTEEENRLLQKYIREGRLNGLSLTDEKSKFRLIGILNEIEKHRNEFRNKVETATKLFIQNVKDPSITREFPAKLLKDISTNRDDPTQGPWKVSLLPHIYQSFLEYCPDKILRWNIWRAYVQRCSGHMEKSLHTSVVLEKLRGFRKDQANILGFKTYADMSMETKMAGSVEKVNEMINFLLDSAKPVQDIEISQLQKFANDNGFPGKLGLSDIAYWQRTQRKVLFNYDKELIREYFPLPIVLQGLFNLCSKLFDIKISPRTDVDTWHEDVKYFEIFQDNGAEAVGGFYLDPYARDDEKIKTIDNSGSFVPIKNRSTVTQSKPLASLIFTFQAPIYGKPSLLSFQEVVGLFHNFGQVLKHILTETNYSDVSGFCNNEWDAADVCGCVMTHFIYEPSTLKAISSHYATQEQLPDDIIQGIIDVKKHMSAFDLCQELYYSTLDLKLYSTPTFWRDIVKEIWPKFQAIPYDRDDAHPCSFTKIVSEDWAAAYYCQLWSRMIAADIYGAFYEAHNDENLVLEVGRRYRDTFLSTGGSCHTSEVFRRFRGRDPNYKALLHALGLIQPSSTPTQ